MNKPIVRGLVDLSSLLWTSLKAGKDKENGERVLDSKGREKIINSAEYGYENFINHLRSAMDQIGLVPSQLIFVPEGQNSKMDRLAIHPNYKGGSSRDKLPGEYKQFNIAKDRIIEIFSNLGSTVIWQDGGVEADDVLGYLAKKLDGIVYVISNDKDMAVLVGGSPGEVTGNVHHWRDGVIDENPFGNFPFKWITTYIALVGDNTDKIPGAVGFGAGAMDDMRAIWGNAGLEAMDELIRTKQLHMLAEDVGQLKKLQIILNDQQNVYMSYELARLRIERVNTLRRPLSFRAGMNKPVYCPDERLRVFQQKRWLVTAANYDEAMKKLHREMHRSPENSFDIETSTCDESDEWIESLGKSEDRTPIDVMGSTLTGFSITFGANREFTYYVSVDHVETDEHKNITVQQARDMVGTLPKDRITWVHNASFELPVCYNTWGKDWADDPVWHGFLPNVRDTRNAASYVDENNSKGLKDLSSRLLNYQQVTYAEVVSRTYKVSEWPGTGKVKVRWTEGATFEEDGTVIDEGTPMITVEHRMNQLKAKDVFEYGCDDTICTAALAVFFRIVMEIEDTFDTFDEVETKPAYLTAKGFVDGVPFSLQGMAKQEADDNKAYDEAWPKLRDFLISIGFEGTTCPQFYTADEIEDMKFAVVQEDPNADLKTWEPPAYVLALDARGIRQAYEIVVGEKMDCKAKRLDKLAKWLELTAMEREDSAATSIALMSTWIMEGDLASLNTMLKDNYDGEPQLNMGSPAQMSRLLYDYMGLPINIINEATLKERAKFPELQDAVYAHKKWRMGEGEPLNDKQLALVRKKAKADEDAINFALAFDKEHISPEAKDALKALGVMKKVLTRRNLFYKNYWPVLHWKTGKIHASFNQVGAVTRRYSCSNPNLQQVPKKGEGVRFREHFKPHKKGAVICSIDFSGQELRLAAERSQDPNMLACYVGDKLKDIHSITAAGAMKLKWGVEAVNEYMGTYGGQFAELEASEASYELFLKLLKDEENVPADLLKKAYDLRKDSKNVNFAAQFGGQAAKLSETLIMLLADAQLFLDARSRMFPLVDKAAKRSAKECLARGYSLTMLGARRHLRVGIMSLDKKEAARAARQSWNFEIQGSAGEMTKLGMARLWDSGALFKYDACFYAPIHDELVSSVMIDDAVEYIRVKHQCMTAKYADMGVPILGSISVGPDFHHQIECGDTFIEERIRKALEDIKNGKFAEEVA
jgi:5'-3' exonuclease